MDDTPLNLRELRGLDRGDAHRRFRAFTRRWAVNPERKQTNSGTDTKPCAIAKAYPALKGAPQPHQDFVNVAQNHNSNRLTGRPDHQGVCFSAENQAENEKLATELFFFFITGVLLRDNEQWTTTTTLILNTIIGLHFWSLRHPTLIFL